MSRRCAKPHGRQDEPAPSPDRAALRAARRMYLAHDRGDMLWFPVASGNALQRPTHCAWRGCAFFAMDCVRSGVPFKVPGGRNAWHSLWCFGRTPRFAGILLLAWLVVRGVAETSSIPSALVCHRCVAFGVVGSRPLRPLLALVCPLLCRNPCEGRLVCGVGKPLSFASWRCSLCRPIGCLTMGR